MSNKTHQQAGRGFLFALIAAVLFSLLAGCNNGGGAPDLGNATPKPPPAGIDPASGKAPSQNAAPQGGARGPR